MGLTRDSVPVPRKGTAEGQRVGRHSALERVLRGLVPGAKGST